MTVAPPPVDLNYVTYWSNDGTSVDGSQPTAAVSAAVSAGLVTVGLGDTTVVNMMALPESVFSQANLQLQIWFSDGVNGFAMLSPLQNLTPAPYAVVADNASNLLGVLPAGQLSGAIGNGNLPANPVFSGTVTANALAGIGTGVTGVNAAALNGLNGTNYWQLEGNNVVPGQFLGSTNFNPVEVWAGGSRAFRLEPVAGNAPNVIGGYSNNFVAPGAYAATIAGGGANGLTNSVWVLAGTVGGGFNNTSSNYDATVSGGANNLAAGNASSVGGGLENGALGDHDAIFGGQGNYISALADHAFIGGGGGGGASSNWIGDYASSSAIGGGGANSIQSYCNNSFIGGGVANMIEFNSYEGTISGGWTNVLQADNPQSTIAGGSHNTIETESYYSAISGGYGNLVGAYGEACTIGGGLFNTNGGTPLTDRRSEAGT